MKRCLISFSKREIKPTEALRPCLSDWQAFQSWNHSAGHAVWSRHKCHWWGPLHSFCPSSPNVQLYTSSNWQILSGGHHRHISPHWEFIKMERTSSGLRSVFMSHIRGSNIPSGRSEVWDQDQGQLLSIPFSPLVQIQHPKGSHAFKTFIVSTVPCGVLNTEDS